MPLNTDEDIRRELAETMRLLVGVRESTKDWEEHYGSERKRKKKKYEQQADEYISRWKIVVTH